MGVKTCASDNVSNCVSPIAKLLREKENQHRRRFTTQTPGRFTKTMKRGRESLKRQGLQELFGKGDQEWLYN